MRTCLWNHVRAVAVLLRAAAGLALHGALRPRTDCAIEGATGRVARA